MSIMYFDMSKIMSIDIGFDRIAKSVYLCSPFAVCLLFYPKSVSMFFSVAMVVVFGLYFLLVQYMVYKSSLGKRPADNPVVG